MRERPILFSNPMVKAIIEGRKCVTRRIVKPQPSFAFTPEVSRYHPLRVDRKGEAFPAAETFGAADLDEDYPCPYGEPGDRLWVREAIWLCKDNGGMDIGHNARDTSGNERVVGYDAMMDVESREIAKSYGFRKHPSIHMPRWACRVVLEITSVRVERLQDITAQEALAEGIPHLGNEFFSMEGYYMPAEVLPPKRRPAAIKSREAYAPAPHIQKALNSWGAPQQPTTYTTDPRMGFFALWNKINGRKMMWQRNPWVWVVHFKRIQ